MADIFLSYAKEDREAARRLSMLLEEAGWSVWWDRRIPAGRTWRDVLEEALRSMGCMVVLWSSQSVDSDWVKEEAEEARSVKKLVPVLIEAVNPPVGFRAIQAADLTDWDGASESVGARQLIADLELLIGKPAPRAALDSKPGISREQDARQTWNEESSPRIIAKQDAKRPAPSHRDSSGKDAMRWKIIVGAGVALALALGVIALWRDDPTPLTDEVAKAVATVQTRSTSETPPVPKVVKLGIHAARQELKPDETLALSLRGHFSDGSENDITNAIEWSSSDPQVAAVNAEGRVTALRSGTTKIAATHDGVSSSAWTLAVQAAEVKPTPAAKLVALTVNVNKKDLAPRERIALHVTGAFSDGSKKSLSDGVVWVSSDAGVASVNVKGELEARRAGKIEVVARLGEVSSAPFGVVVKDPATKPATVPQERKGDVLSTVEGVGKILDDMPRKTPDYTAVEKTPNARAVVPQDTAEQLRAKVAPYISRAKNFRAQGDYRAAMAELATARSVDATSQEVGAEIEQTKRACIAEKKLGSRGLDC